MTIAAKTADLTKVINETTRALDVTEASLDAQVAAAQGSATSAQAEQATAEGYRDETTAYAASVAGDLTTVQGNMTYNGISAILAQKAVTAVDVFVYDTSLDSDGGAWRKRCQHTSWYNEALNTATRGARRTFPAVAVIVAEASGAITIFDGDNPSLPMWMVLTWNVDPYRFSIAAKNGIIAIGNSYTPNAAYGGNGLALWSFPNAVLRRSLLNSSSSGWFAFYEGFTSRITVRDGPINTTHGSDVSRREFSLVSYQINDIAMTVLPDAPADPATGLPLPTIAVGTVGGTSIIKHDSTVVSDNSLDHNPNSVSVNFDSEGNLWIIAAGSHHFVWRPPYAASGASGSLGPYRFGGALSQWQSWAGGSVALLPAGGADLVYGHNRALTRYTSGAHAYIRSASTSGWMPEYTRLAACADTSTASLVDKDYVTLKTPDVACVPARITLSGSDLIVDARVGEDNQSQITDVFADLKENTTYILQFTKTSDTGGGHQSAWIGVGYGALAQGRCAFSGHYGTMAIGHLPAGEYALTFTTGTRIGDVGLFMRSVNTTVDTVHRFENISVRPADADRSRQNKALVVNGTITRSPVANGAELVGYSGFSTTNFLEQPYNSALDFGTGDFCVMGWHKSSGSNNNADIFARGTILAQTDDRLIRLIRWANGRYAFGVSRIGIGGDGVEYQAGNVTNWAHIACIRKNSQLELWFDGRLVASGPSTIDTSQPGAVLRLGHYVYSMVGSAALWRISATAPTPDQIAKIYEDERKLFMPGAACTLYGTSDAVTALAQDPKTNLLHVGTSQGRSVFDGLHRVAHTETPVTTAIAAVNGLIVEQ